MILNFQIIVGLDFTNHMDMQVPFSLHKIICKAKSGEVILPGTRLTHNIINYSTGYSEGDIVTVYYDFASKTLSFFVNRKFQVIFRIFQNVEGNCSAKFRFSK